jgi:hypothetical protein
MNAKLRIDFVRSPATLLSLTGLHLFLLIMQPAFSAERDCKQLPGEWQGRRVQAGTSSTYVFSPQAVVRLGRGEQQAASAQQKPTTTADLFNEFNAMCKELELLVQQKKISYWERMDFCQRYSATGNVALLIGSSDAALRARLGKARAEFRELKRKAGLDPSQPILNPHELKQASKVLVQTRLTDGNAGVLKTFTLTDVDFGYVPGERTSLSYFSGVELQRAGAGPPRCVLVYKEGGTRLGLTSFQTPSPSETIQLCSMFQRAIQEFNDKYFPAERTASGNSPPQPSEAVAPPGLYLEISVCHACAYPDWQAKLMAALKANNWPTFVGELKYDPVKRRIHPVRKTPRAPDWTWSVWIGPFATREKAVDALERLPAAIEPVLRVQSQQAVLETELTNGDKVSGYRGGPRVAMYWVGLHWVRIYRIHSDYGVVEN